MLKTAPTGSLFVGVTLNERCNKLRGSRLLGYTNEFMMNRSFILIAVLLVLGSDLQAQQWKQTSGPGGDFVKCSVFDSHGHLFVARNSLHRSTDNGVTWQRIFLQMPAGVITSVIAQTSGRIFIQVASTVGYSDEPTSGNIFFSDDDGDNWQLLPIHGFQIWKGVANELFSIDSIKHLIRSNDNGNSWQPLDTIGINGNIAYVASDSAHNLFIVSAKDHYVEGPLYRSTDDGKNWSKLVNGIYEVSEVQQIENKLFARTESHSIITSSDSGRTWKPSTSGIPSYHSNSNGSILALTNEHSGFILSEDTGNTWNTVPSFLRIRGSRYARPNGIFNNQESDFYLANGSGIFKLDLNNIPNSIRISVPNDKVTAIICGRNNDIVAFGGGDSAYGWYSTNQGLNWESLTRVDMGSIKK